MNSNERFIFFKWISLNVQFRLHEWASICMTYLKETWIFWYFSRHLQWKYLERYNVFDCGTGNFTIRNEKQFHLSPMLPRTFYQILHELFYCVFDQKPIRSSRNTRRFMVHKNIWNIQISYIDSSSRESKEKECEKRQ